MRRAESMPCQRGLFPLSSLDAMTTARNDFTDTFPSRKGELQNGTQRISLFRILSLTNINVLAVIRCFILSLYYNVVGAYVIHSQKAKIINYFLSSSFELEIATSRSRRNGFSYSLSARTPGPTRLFTRHDEVECLHLRRMKLH